MFNYAHAIESKKEIVNDVTITDVGVTLNSAYDLNPLFSHRLQNTDLMVPFVTNTEGLNLALISADPLNDDNLNIVNSMMDTLIENQLDSMVFTFIGYNDEIADFLNVSTFSNVLIFVKDKSPMYFYVFDDKKDAYYDEYKVVVRLIKETVFQ